MLTGILRTNEESGPDQFCTQRIIDRAGNTEPVEKQGRFTEQLDEADKRVKMVSISEKEEKVLIPCLEKAGMIRAFMFKDLSEADRKTCATLLEPVEAVHAKVCCNCAVDDGRDHNQ